MSSEDVYIGTILLLLSVEKGEVKIFLKKMKKTLDKPVLLCYTTQAIVADGVFSRLQGRLYRH